MSPRKVIFVLRDDVSKEPIRMRAPRLRSDPIIGFSSKTLAESFVKLLRQDRHLSVARLPAGVKTQTVLFCSQLEISAYQKAPQQFRYEEALVPSLRGAAAYFPGFFLRFIRGASPSKED